MNRRALILTGLAAAGAAALTVGLKRVRPHQQKESQLKIISLYPPVTSAIFEMGEQNKLSGRSQYCNSPESALNLKAFGTGLTPDLEAIAGFRPDLILLDGSAGAKVEQLKSLARVESLSWLNQSDVLKSLDSLGQILEAPEKAKRLANRFEETLIAQNTKESPSLLLALASDDLGRGPVWFLKNDSLHGDAIKAAGFNNAIPEAISGPPSISIEELIQVDPDLIVILATDKYSEEQAKALARKFDDITPLKAVKRKRIGVIRGTKYISTGPQFLELIPILKAEGSRLMSNEDD